MVNERKLYEILSDEGIEIARQLKAVDADVFLFEGKDFDLKVEKNIVMSSEVEDEEEQEEGQKNLL